MFWTGGPPEYRQETPSPFKYNRRKVFVFFSEIVWIYQQLFMDFSKFFWGFHDTFFGLVGGGPPEYRQGAPGPLEHNRRTLLRWSVTKGGDMPCFERTFLYSFSCRIYILYFFIYHGHWSVSQKARTESVQFCFESSYLSNEQWINKLANTKLRKFSKNCIVS